MIEEQRLDERNVIVHEYELDSLKNILGNGS